MNFYFFLFNFIVTLLTFAKTHPHTPTHTHTQSFLLLFPNLLPIRQYLSFSIMLMVNAVLQLLSPKAIESNYPLPLCDMMPLQLKIELTWFPTLISNSSDLPSSIPHTSSALVLFRHVLSLNLSYIIFPNCLNLHFFQAESHCFLPIILISQGSFAIFLCSITHLQLIPGQ